MTSLPLPLPLPLPTIKIGKALPLPVIKVSFTGSSPRTKDGVIVQVAVDLNVEYEGITQHEVLYSGDFKDIVGHPMTQEVADALDVLSAHFAGLVQQDYGVLPS